MESALRHPWSISCLHQLLPGLVHTSIESVDTNVSLVLLRLAMLLTSMEGHDQRTWLRIEK